jgi:maltoporin
MARRGKFFLTGFFLISLFALAGSASRASDDEGEYVGYLRVGGGVSQGGGPQKCYYLGNGDGHGYRLGNECDSYTEFGYARTFAKADDGVRFVGHIMVADYSGDSAYSGNLQISQIYADIKGLYWLNGGTAWVGERYYERPDIHWMDLQYINLNGTGGGFDNIDTAWGGKFSYAVFKDDDTNNYSGTQLGSSFISSNSAVRNNVLYRGLPTNPGGTLDVVLGLILASSPSSDRHDGYYANLFHKQDIFGGGNTFGVQYGVGPGTGRGAPLAFNSSQPNAAFGPAGGAGPDAICCNRMGQSGSTLLGSDDTRLRVFDALWIQPTQRFSAAFTALFQGDRSPIYGGTSDWDSFGVRPEYAFFSHFKLQGEIGVDRVSYPGAATENLIKYTIAPTLTLGPGFYDRPELRLFVTRANWNSAATATINSNNAANPTSIGLVTSDTSVGVQLEAWWGKNWF